MGRRMENASRITLSRIVLFRTNPHLVKSIDAFLLSYSIILFHYLFKEGINKDPPSTGTKVPKNGTQDGLLPFLEFY